jgi:hypothetical protein
MFPGSRDAVADLRVEAMRRAILIAVVLCCAGRAVAEEAPDFGPFPTFKDGNELFSKCEGFRQQNVSSDEAMRFEYCHAYVTGVADSLAMFKAVAKSKRFWVQAYCPPEGVDSDQVTSVVTNYLRDHPKKRHLAAASLVTHALTEKFPCN